jgi:multidrug efflux system membrane fusion protein
MMARQGFNMRVKQWQLVVMGLVLVGAGGWVWQQWSSSDAAQGQPGVASSPQAAPQASGQRPAGQGRPQGGPGARQGGGGNPWTMPVPVRVVATKQQDLTVQLKTIGTVVPEQTVLVQSRVSGVLQKLHFQEGDVVQAGQLLAQIDPAEFQVQLAQAEGQQQQNIAQLSNAKADLALYEKLVAQKSISQQQFNQQQALVKQLEGTLKSDQARVDAARLQLSYTKITAPITGRTGLRKVDVGNLIQANNATGLVSITQSQPVNVLFTIAETELPQVRASLQQTQQLTVEAWDRNEKIRFATGALKTLDNQIDVSTGTVKIKARFDNTDEQLFPNQFVNVRLNVATRDQALTIPVDAVQYGASGTYVYVIKENKAEVKPVQLGPVAGDIVAIEQGLAVGDLVVLEGLDRLRPGRQVEVIGQPSAKEKPKATTPASSTSTKPASSPSTSPATTGN